MEEKTNRRERIRVYESKDRDGYSRQQGSYNRERNFNRNGEEGNYSGYRRNSYDRGNNGQGQRRNYSREYSSDFGNTTGFDSANSERRPRYNNNRGGDGQHRNYNQQRYDRNQYGNNGGFEDGNNSRGDFQARPKRQRIQRPVDGNRFSYSDYEQRDQYVDGNSDRPAYQRNNNGGNYNNRGNRNHNNNGNRNFNNNRGGYNNNGGGYNNNGGQKQQKKRTADYNPNAKYSKKKQMIYKELNVDPNEPIRLNKYLANSGVCSRREADEFIQAGVVSVNDVIVTELGTKVKRSDIVKFHDQLVSPERKVYILLNKPKDCVTTSDDPQERHTVLDLVQGACDERVYPVGRLDRNTTGVLLLTNDGELASKLTHPKFLKKKIYYVKLDKPFEEADMQKLAEGITLEDGEIKADDISYVSEEEKDKVGIEIHSGKNRIVRRMFESLGYHVKQLDRVFFAGLTKKGLRRGEWRFLTQREVNMLQMGAFE